MNNSAKRASIILGVFMAVVLIGSTFLQLFSRETQQAANQPQPTQRVDATFPPPLDPAGTAFESFYLHPSGIFAIAQPTGFTPSQPASRPGIAQINMVNNESLAVIDSFVQDPGVPVSADTLDAYFTADVLDQTWTNFEQWTENSRRRDGEDLLIDFSVRYNRQNYVARQRAWTDGEWIYAVRVLAPDNATDYLVSILDGVRPTLRAFKQYAGQPFDWGLYYDPTSSVGIRHPATWTVTDGAPGRPVSIAGADGEVLRLESQTGAIADEAAARAWVEAARPGASILSVSAVEGELSGFRVAYRVTGPDGDPQSGLAVLLGGPEGQLYTANLRFPGEAVDLNTLASSAAAPAAEATA